MRSTIPTHYLSSVLSTSETVYRIILILDISPLLKELSVSKF